MPKVTWRAILNSAGNAFDGAVEDALRGIDEEDMPNDEKDLVVSDAKAYLRDNGGYVELPEAGNTTWKEILSADYSTFESQLRRALDRTSLRSATVKQQIVREVRDDLNFGEATIRLSERDFS
jgi:hypothetical protein